jgi:hypothetical protein
MTAIIHASIRASIVASATIAATLLGVSIGTAAPKAPRVQTGPDAEITYDGLHRVDRTVMDAAWVKPDLDLTGYTKLIVASGGVSFRDVRPTNSRRATEFPVQEQNKERLRQILREEFVEELEKLDRYEFVSEPGPDVLVLVGAVIDVVSSVPPDRAGRGGVYLSSVGQATLVIELRDSQTNEVLARAADRRAAESPFAFEASAPMAWSQVRRLAKSWAGLVRRGLEDFNGV